MKPTTAQFTAYQAAFDWFNDRLFAGSLPPCMLNFSRMRKAMGFYCPRVWAKGDEAVAEISLNPDALLRPARESLSTLAHEMAHHWQEVFGSPSRGGHHNREWAEKMGEIGLAPVSIPPGKRTGRNMTHEILPEGPFARAFDAAPAEVLLPWTTAAVLDGDEAEKKKKANKAKRKTAYRCPSCEAKAWGKAELRILCGDCGDEFVAEEGAEDDR